MNDMTPSAPRSLSHITDWVFDLDNTLHNASPHIFPHINRSMTAYLEQHLALSREEANALRMQYWHRYGATLLGLMRHHGTDPRHFLVETHRFERLHEMMVFDRALRGMLRKLPGRRFVFSNAPRHYAHAALEVMGISRLFEDVVASDGVTNLKGPAKAKKLRETFPDGFAYAGDAASDLPGLAGVNDRLHIAAAPVSADQNQDADGRAGHRICTSRAPFTISPICQAFSPCALKNSQAAGACQRDTTSTSPMPILNVRYISVSGTLPHFWIRSKMGGGVQLRRSMAARASCGSTRGVLSYNPPPVMCAITRIDRSCWMAACTL